MNLWNQIKIYFGMVAIGSTIASSADAQEVQIPEQDRQEVVDRSRGTIFDEDYDTEDRSVDDIDETLDDLAGPTDNLTNDGSPESGSSGDYANRLDAEQMIVLEDQLTEEEFSVFNEVRNRFEISQRLLIPIGTTLGYNSAGSFSITDSYDHFDFRQDPRLREQIFRVALPSGDVIDLNLDVNGDEDWFRVEYARICNDLGTRIPALCKQVYTQNLREGENAPSRGQAVFYVRELRTSPETPGRLVSADSTEMIGENEFFEDLLVWCDNGYGNCMNREGETISRVRNVRSQGAFAIHDGERQALRHLILQTVDDDYMRNHSDEIPRSSVRIPLELYVRPNGFVFPVSAANEEDCPEPGETIIQEVEVPGPERVVERIVSSGRQETGWGFGLDPMFIINYMQTNDGPVYMIGGNIRLNTPRNIVASIGFTHSIAGMDRERAYSRGVLDDGRTQILREWEINRTLMMFRANVGYHISLPRGWGLSIEPGAYVSVSNQRHIERGRSYGGDDYCEPIDLELIRENEPQTGIGGGLEFDLVVESSPNNNGWSWYAGLGGGMGYHDDQTDDGVNGFGTVRTGLRYGGVLRSIIRNDEQE